MAFNDPGNKLQKICLTFYSDIEAIFADLDGIEFIAKIETYVNQYGEQKNELKMAITPDHKDYAMIKNGNAPQTQHQQSINNSIRQIWS